MPYDKTKQAKNYQASEQALLEAGGRRINFRAQPGAVRALRAFMRRFKVDQTSAINTALENLKHLKEIS